jgi:hypothetical protein
MNVWTAVILGALLVEYALEVAADALNVRALDPEVPAAFRDVYDAERYREAQRYARVRTRFGLVRRTVDLALLLAFWFAGGFHWLDTAVRGLGLGAIPSGLVFVGSLVLGQGIVSIPLRWWSTFVIEAHFGFNRTSPRTFWIDLAKGLVLAALLGGGLLAAILWLLAVAGPQAWLATSRAYSTSSAPRMTAVQTFIRPLSRPRPRPASRRGCRAARGGHDPRSRGRSRSRGPSPSRTRESRRRPRARRSAP